MLVEYAYAQNYLFTALEAAPDLLDHLLVGLTQEEADWRDDSDRFTIREAMAHLADWEPVFLERMRRICAEDIPLLPGYDESEWAIEHRYRETDPFEQSRLFRARRAEMVAFLRSCSPEAWQRQGNRPEIGLITLEALALLIPLHDTYHLQHLAQVRQKQP